MNNEEEKERKKERKKEKKRKSSNYRRIEKLGKWNRMKQMAWRTEDCRKQINR